MPHILLISFEKTSGAFDNCKDMPKTLTCQCPFQN